MCVLCVCAVCAVCVLCVCYVCVDVCYVCAVCVLCVCGCVCVLCGTHSAVNCALSSKVGVTPIETLVTAGTMHQHFHGLFQCH